MHYLNQCWPSSLTHICGTEGKWVNGRQSRMRRINGFADPPILYNSSEYYLTTFSINICVILLMFKIPSSTAVIGPINNKSALVYLTALCCTGANTKTNNDQASWRTVYPKKYAHGFVVLCFVVVMQSFIMNSHDVFIHIHQGCFAGTGAIVRLPQCQWSKSDGYGWKAAITHPCNTHIKPQLWLHTPVVYNGNTCLLQ